MMMTSLVAAVAPRTQKLPQCYSD